MEQRIEKDLAAIHSRQPEKRRRPGISQGSRDRTYCLLQGRIVNIRRMFSPKPTLSEQEVTAGLRWLTRKGTVSVGFDRLTTSGFLTAFALALSASNLQVGVLAGSRF